MKKNIVDDNIKDYSILAQDSYSNYNNIKDIKNFTKLSYKNQDLAIKEIRENTENGFHAKVYTNEKTNEIIISYTGTNTSPKEERDKDWEKKR